VILKSEKTEDSSEQMAGHLRKRVKQNNIKIVFVAKVAHSYIILYSVLLQNQ
jgi:hypothetical protein